MTVTADLSGVRQTRWHELLLRFATGGLITVAAGLVAQRFGAVIGGLFLAFPAIFPASATLIAKHEHEKKMAKGLAGRRRGIEAAAVDACGTALGSIGLVAFAGTSWWLLRAHAPVLALASAMAAWLAAAVFAWWLHRRRHQRR
ncbi:MAG TPA: DUF3147 family protein [Bryobacteraceae bacterium]|nr:DUF3147 family protein [Bryobacteraceae bacterium]